MKDYVKIFLNKKFPHKIEVISKEHYKLPGVNLELYKSGDKRLFVRMVGGEQTVYHYYEAHPEDLQIWFQLSYKIAEQKLIDWVSERIKNQES